jgi:hypothetical protein
MSKLNTHAPQPKALNVFRRNFVRTLRRYRHVPLLSIAKLYIRALLIGRRTIAPMPAPNRSRRVVVTLSTIPSRAMHLRSTLNSLLAQTTPADRIMLALPAHSKRENRPYPAVTELNIPAGIDVVQTQDLGPATKVLPAVSAERDAIIIVVDDDVIYPPHFIETLVAAHNAHPQKALAYRGVNIDTSREFVDLEHIFASGIGAAQKVDIVFGTWGYLLPPGTLFEGMDGTSKTQDAHKWVDDIWVSGQLAKNGVERLIVAATEIPIETMNAARLSLAGGPNQSGENDRRAIQAFEQYW